jgi:hypothetical protein
MKEAMLARLIGSVSRVSIRVSHVSSKSTTTPFPARILRVSLFKAFLRQQLLGNNHSVKPWLMISICSASLNSAAQVVDRLGSTYCSCKDRRSVPDPL